MALYVTRALLEVNGAQETNFKKVTQHARVVAKPVPLMYRSGSALLTQRFSIEVDYVVPAINPFDWSQVKDGTFTVEYDSGERTDYAGVYVTQVGEAAVDGENELVQAITMSCETRNGSTGA